MTADQSAIDALKDKIAQFKAASAAKDGSEFHAPDADLIALANVGNGKAAHYVWHSINIDWNPLDHPRDPNTGEFAKAPGGYIFGKAKKAKFKGNLVANNVELGPGDVAFKTNLGNVLISHPDGSYTLHHKQDGKHKVSKVPAGAISKIAQMSQDGELEKIGENPGVSVPAKSKTEAAFKLEHPSEGVPHDLPKDKQVAGSAWDVEKPTLKAGKTAFTAKQYAEYQEAVKGLPMGPDKDGKTVNAGDWVDVDGKPYLIYPSPHAGEGNNFNLSVYRWVTTKQQASNLVKEDLFTLSDFGNMTVIPDPTGKPYGKDLTEVSEDAPKAGSLMSQAAAVAIPNTSTAHKKHVADKKGTILADASNTVLGDLNGKAIASGDWMQIEGKPVQVHDSPNEGFVAIAKWVGTKQQASNNTYDFPEEVVSTGVVIPDPTGKAYTPVVVEKKYGVAKKSAAKKAAAPKPVAATPVSLDELQNSEPGTAFTVTFEDGSVSSFKMNDDGTGMWFNVDSPENGGYGSGVLFNDFVLNNAGVKKYDFTPPSDEDFGDLMPTTAEGLTQAEVADGIDGANPMSTVVIASSKETGNPVIQAIFVKQEDGLWKDTLGQWSNVSNKSLKSVVLHDDPTVADPSMEYFAINATFAGEDPKKPGLEMYSEEWFGSVPDGSQITESPTALHPGYATAKTTVFTKTAGEWKSENGGSSIPNSTFANAFAGEASDWWQYSYVSAQDVPLADWEQELLDGQEAVADGGWSEKDKHDAVVMGQINKGYIGDTLALELLNGGSATYEKTGSDEWKLQVYSGPDEGEPTGTFDNWNMSLLVGESMGSTYEVNEPDAVPVGNVFVHPVSKATWELGPTDIVFKNKKVANSWIIYSPDSDPEKAYNYYTSTGKLQKPKESHKGFSDNYEIDENWPGSNNTDENLIIPGSFATAEQIDNASTGTVMVEKGIQVYNAQHSGVYIKQSNGFWKNEKDSWEGPINGADSVANPNFDWYIYPPGTHEDNQTPILPIAEIEKETKPVVKGKKAVKGKEVLPTEFTIPNTEKTITLKPGEFLVKAIVPEGYSNGGTVYYILVKPGAKSYNEFYALDGTSTHLYAFSQATPAQMKQYVKGTNSFQTGHGPASFEFVAEKPVLKVEATDFSVYGPVKSIKELSQHDANKADYYHASNAFYQIRNDWLDPITTNITYYNGNFYPGGSIPKLDGAENENVSWNNASMDDKLAFVANMEEVIGRGVLTMQGVDELNITDKAEKAKATKFKNALINAHRVTQIAKAYQDPDTAGWDDDRFEQELAWVQKVTNSKAANFSDLRKQFPMDGFNQLFIAAEAQRKFKNNLGDLGFDPFNGTTEDYDKFAKSKGFTALAALEPEYQKLWVLNEIGDPSLTANQKTSATGLAQAAQSKLNIATYAATIEQNELAVKDEAGGTKGAAIKSQLKKSYTITTPKNVVKFKYLSPNEWAWEIQDVNGGAVLKQPNANDGIVYAVLNASLSNGDDVDASDKLAYGPVTDIVQASKDWLEARGVEWPAGSFTEAGPEFREAIVAAGANFPKDEGLGSGSTATLKRWLRYEVEGDYIGQFALENKLYEGLGLVHPKADSHPGSPQSPIGQIAHKALAIHALKHPEGVDWLTGKAVYWNELSEHLGIGQINDQWKEEHDFSVIASYAAGSADYGTANKPVDVSANVWNITNSLEPSSDYATLLGADWEKYKNSDEASLDSLLTGSTGKALGYNSLTVPSIPIHLKRVAAWGLVANAQENDRKSFASAVIAKAKAGEFLTDKTPVWISPNGEKYPISPGGQVYKSGTDSFMLTGPVGPNGKPTSGFNFVSGQAAPQPVSAYTLNDLTGYGWEHVFTMPNPITWEKAKTDNPGMDELIFNLSEKIESGEYTKFQHHLSGPLLTAELKKNESLKNNYPSLYANHKSLPEHVRQAVMAALEQDNNPLLMVMDYKAQAGHYASMSSKGLFDASQPWIPHLSKGQLETDAVLNNWTPAAKDAFVSYFKLKSHDDIAPHLDSMLNPEQVAISKALPKIEDLSLTYVKDKSALGGMHSGGIWVDQDGNEWMTKGFPSSTDPAGNKNGPARVDAEDAANRIALLYGFDAPVTYALSLKDITGGKDKQYSYLQHLKPASGDFAGKTPKNLTTKQLQQAMSEHIVDWITSNHDSHKQNLMLTPEGKVFGIDKGQAFKHFPNDKLAVGYLPPENGAPVWYDQFYYALTSGQISKEQADEVTKYVLRMAQKISKDKDEEYRALLQHALKTREFWPEQFPTREKFIDGLVERKHNTFNDFVALYKSLYKQSPYEWDIDPDNLTPPSLGEGQVHIAVSQNFAEDVEKANAYGKALFFDSKDLEDSHIMFSKVTGPNGKPWLTGEAKVRKAGDKKLTEWLQKQTVEHKTSPGHTYNSKQGYAYYESGPDYEDQPMSPNWFSAMVAYSKTVSSHNKNGDKEYNKGTQATAEATKKQLQKTKELIAQWKAENGDKPFSGTIASESSDNGNGSMPGFNVALVTKEQQDAWEAMIDTYLDYYEKVKVKEGTDEKVTPHFTQPTYTATDAAKKQALSVSDDMPKSSLEAPVGTIVKSGSYSYTKTDDETWTNAGGSEFTIQALQDAWKYMTLEKLGEPVDEPEADEDEVLTAEVQVGTKVLKVTYRPAASKAGTLNTETGEFSASDSEISNFDFGNMYEIDFGNSVVEYRPWDGSNVAPAQQGLLKFRKKDWDGDSESIDEILDVLRHVGLDLDPANEEALELFYYRHLSAQIGDRSEGKAGTGTYGSTYKAIQNELTGKTDLSNEQELAIHKAAWTNALGADVVEKIDWLPQFSRLRPQVAGEGNNEDEQHIGTGRPYWNRPTTSYKDLRSIFGNGTKLPASSMHKTGDALKVAKSGTYMSSEERYRILSQGFKEGMSSSTDATNHGSSAVVYIRQGLSFTEVGHEAAFFHPKILRRTHNYAFASDSYGDINKKKNSAWDIKAMSKFTGGGNELMVKNALAVLDDILFLKFYSESDRQEAIKFYKSLGITTIHGIPIEKLFRTDMYDNEAQQIAKQVWDQLVDEEEKAA